MSNLKTFSFKPFSFSYFLTGFFFLFVFHVCITAAWAQNKMDLNDLAPNETLLNIAADEQVKVGHDLAEASVTAQSDAHTRAEAQSEVNEDISEALRKLKGIDNITYSTGTYRVYQYTPQKNAPQLDENGRLIRWRAVQPLLIEGKDFDAVAKAVGILQDEGFLASGLSTRISSELYAKTRDDLMEKALEKLKERAERAGKTLGKNDLSFIEVNVQSTGRHPMPYRALDRSAHMEMSMASSAGMAPPSVEGGEDFISLSVSARVILK